MTANDLVLFLQGFAYVGVAAAMIQATYQINKLQKDTEELESL